MLAVALAGLAACDLLAWAAFRLDKARAGRGGRRLRERTLLALAVPGGLGALVAMYGHRRRHKVAKARFVAIAVLASAAQLAAIGWLTLGMP